jgi:predicted O-methyltransferase YrrM
MDCGKAPVNEPNTELIAKWRHVLDAAKVGKVVTGDAELAYWAEEASRAQTIVEVGTYIGHSAKVMLLANPQCRLFTIDPFYEPGTFDKAQKHLAPELITGRCHILRMRSPEAGKLLFAPIDLLVIDDGHEESEVEDDLRSLYPLLKIGGTACGHDLDRNPDNGVTKAVRRLLPGFLEPTSRVWSIRKEAEAPWQ